MIGQAGIMICLGRCRYAWADWSTGVGIEMHSAKKGFGVVELGIGAYFIHHCEGVKRVLEGQIFGTVLDSVHRLEIPNK
jgi:hypothetical protein